MTSVLERLSALRTELRSDLEHDASDLGRDIEDRGEDLTPSQHPADVASDLYAREELVADGAAIGRELAEVEDALDRVVRGTYGVCIECGGPIGQERLAARPQAARCIGCQRRIERLARR